MALIKDYKVKDTGLEIPNAYHVIKDVYLYKRYYDAKPPVDLIGQRNDFPEFYSQDDIYIKKGYIAIVKIDVYVNKECRNIEKNPIGSLGEDNQYKFMFDPESSESILSQAYSYLKTTEEYKDCAED